MRTKDKIPSFLGLWLSDPGNTDASDGAGLRLKEMARSGMVKNNAGAPILKGRNDDDEGLEGDEPATFFWDGGLADMFPTFSEDTIIISPHNSRYDLNPLN